MAEMNWSEIHEFVQGFFYANEDDLNLNVMYGSTGLACVKKLSRRGVPAVKPKRVVRRDNGSFNRMRYKFQPIYSQIKNRIVSILK
jgi:hypothetical protein